jgi:hypothetical protein
MSTEQTKPDIPLQEGNIEKALKNLCDGVPCHLVARLVYHASHAGRISYGEAKQLLGEDLDEALLTAVHLRLLIPVRSSNDSLNWVDAVLLFEAGEIYKMPNISRQLVLRAGFSGRWEPDYAVSTLFHEMGEPNWGLMPVLVRRLSSLAKDQHVTGFQIERVCTEMGLAGKAGALILELKGAGIMSPKLDSFSEVQRAGAPIYEINRSILLSLSQVPTG